MDIISQINEAQDAQRVDLVDALNSYIATRDIHALEESIDRLGLKYMSGRTGDSSLATPELKDMIFEFVDLHKSDADEEELVKECGYLIESVEAAYENTI